MKMSGKHLLIVTYLTVLFCLALPLAAAWGQSEKPVGDSPGPEGDRRYVSIDFNDVDIGVFIKFMSELTGKNFVVDQRVKGKVTIISPAKISTEEAYKVFESVLEVNGFATVKAGEIIKVIPSPDARTKNIRTNLIAEAASPDDRIVTQLIPLKYADPEEIRKLFTPLISKNSVLLSYSPTNMLVLTDVYSNVQRLMGILKVIDVTDIGQQLSVLPIEYADATKLVQLLETVFDTRKQATRGQGAASVIKMVADERTNTIVLLASEGETEKVRDLIALIDKEAPKGSEKIRVYYLENAKAEELATALQSLSTKKSSTPAEGKKSPVVSGNVSITADKATNSLIIMAEKDDYMVLEEIIHKLDIPRAMVYIECLIMEVNVTKDFNLGVEWITGNDFDNGDAAWVGGFSGGASGGDSGYSTISGASDRLPAGLALGFFKDAIEVQVSGVTLTYPNIGAVVQAYKKDRDVNILSTPQILTTDNEEATITVGKNVPYKTKSGTDVSSGVTDNIFYETFEYKDVGITLKVTPQISKDRMVRLTLSQEVTKLESTVDYRPTTLKRTIDTTVIVNDKNTVVIGGLIDDSFSNVEYKTPCVGDLPGLGKLFSSVGKSVDKTNLFVFLTPYVIQNQSEAKKVYEDKKESMGAVQEGRIKMYDKKKAIPEEEGLKGIDLTK
jgi:general secretion pathway protein D